MSNILKLVSEPCFSHLQRRARTEGWELRRSDLTIRRILLPPDDCLDPQAWVPPFGDDHEARAFVSQRASQDLEEEPAVAIHQLALRLSQDRPETMLLAGAVTRAREAHLGFSAQRIEEAIGAARRAAQPHFTDEFSWAAAYGAALGRLEGGTAVVEIWAKMGDCTPQRRAMDQVLCAIASEVIALRRSERAAASQHENEGHGGQGEAGPPEPRASR